VISVHLPERRLCRVYSAGDPGISGAVLIRFHSDPVEPIGFHTLGFTPFGRGTPVISEFARGQNKRGLADGS
jgi:hypothetical protein